MDDQTNQVDARPGAVERAHESGAVGLGRGGRMSRQRKSAAVLRLMRQNNLRAPTRAGAPRGPRNHDGTIILDTVDTM